MKKYSEAKSIKFLELVGISKKTIENHYEKLYFGYVNKWEEIQKQLEVVDFLTANASYSNLRELKIEESFVMNAIILHEAYFDILGGKGIPQGEIVPFIERDFGSIQEWLEEYKSLGSCSRGWVVLGYDFNDGKLKNIILDSHNLYGLVGFAPIVVMDMYEHAYFIDFGADKKSYIETFFKNIDWQSVNAKFQKIFKK